MATVQRGGGVDRTSYIGYIRRTILLGNGQPAANKAVYITTDSGAARLYSRDGLKLINSNGYLTTDANGFFEGYVEDARVYYISVRNKNGGEVELYREDNVDPGSSGMLAGAIKAQVPQTNLLTPPQVVEQSTGLVSVNALGQLIAPDGTVIPVSTASGASGVKGTVGPATPARTDLTAAGLSGLPVWINLIPAPGCTLAVATSTDGGITWDAAVDVSADTTFQYHAHLTESWATHVNIAQTSGVATTSTWAIWP